jgi:trehalose 6-phosphate phosphatase
MASASIRSLQEPAMDVHAPPLVPNLKEWAILLDVDGTILDLAPTPNEVTVPASLRDTMSRLSERTGGALALVSGRSLSDLDALFAPLRLPAVAGHGAELRRFAGGAPEAAGEPSLDPALRRKLRTVGRIAAGVLIEDKGYSVALHYRMAPDMEQVVRAEVDRIRIENPAAPIEILPGKSVLEIKQAGFNKGTGVRALMAQPPFASRQPIFIGDDVTDESVFEMIAEFDGLAFSVGRIASGVSGYFAKPEAVRGWLSRIAGGEVEAAR